jgi:3-dehydroquinate synthetase
MRNALYLNYIDYISTPIDMDAVFQALTKDKKNTGSKINLILPVGDILEKRSFENSNAFWEQARLALLQTPITVQS